MSPDDRLLDLARAVGEGDALEWDALEQSMAQSDVAVVRNLRSIASIAGVYRTLQVGVTAPTGDIGSSWRHLEIRDVLGRGSAGDVYAAWDPRLETDVALKVLRTTGGEAGAERIDEALRTAKVRHPNVVRVHGADVHDGRVGVWMELVRGRSLEALLRDQGPFGWREATVIGMDLCAALAAVHQAGLLHRDLKAQNVLREEGGRIVLMDFSTGIEAVSAPDAPAVGTPLYLSPEILLGKPATERADIYSLGVLLFHLVTGRYPVEGRTLAELRSAHAQARGSHLLDFRADLPEAFAAVVDRALAPDPQARFASAGELRQALAHALGISAVPSSGPSGTFRLLRTLGKGAVGLLAAAAAVSGLLIVTSRMKTPVLVPATPVESLSPQGTVPYTVEAALYRVPADSNGRERLEPGTRLVLGDKLMLDFEASAPLHVYVIDEDDVGHSYALFPLPGLDQQNPLSPNEAHVLPGRRDGKDLSWKVDTPGGREHLMVLASPTRLVEFEAEMNALARPGETAVSIPEAAKVHLRGIGGLAETPATSGAKSARHLFDLAQRLASRSEIVKGVWIRQIELENPRTQQ